MPPADCLLPFEVFFSGAGLEMVFPDSEVDTGEDAVVASHGYGISHAGNGKRLPVERGGCKQYGGDSILKSLRGGSLI